MTFSARVMRPSRSATRASTDWVASWYGSTGLAGFFALASAAPEAAPTTTARVETPAPLAKARRVVLGVSESAMVSSL